MNQYRRTNFVNTMKMLVVVTLVVPLALAQCTQAPNDKQDSSSATENAENAQWFVDITNDAGVDFVHESGATGKFYLPEIMGSGVALFDCDNDDDLDIYFLNGNLRFESEESGRSPQNQLFRKNHDGRFTNITVESGLGDDGYGMGAAVGDIDNDGDLDVYVTNFGLDRLYRNDGNATFTDITQSSGVSVEDWSASAAFLDFDRDGFLDLIVTRYLKFNPSRECTDAAGRPDYCSPKAYQALPDVLLHNEGNGTFRDVTVEAGLSEVYGHGLGVVCADFNDDSWIDIYVANDGDANQLWINQKNGTFQDKAIISGVAFNMHGRAEAGMGVVAAEFDNDGRLDLFLTHLRNETNTLYTRTGTGSFFSDSSGVSGLGSPSLRSTGFGVASLDLELDGDLDLLIVNGSVARSDVKTGSLLSEPWMNYAEPNVMFLNDGSGRFAVQNDDCGSFCRDIEITRGLALGDLDKDGDLDAVISNTQGHGRVILNKAPRQGRWLMVRATDPRLRRDVIGATIIVVCENQQFQRTIGGNASYLSSSELTAHFGLGNNDKITRIEVHWLDGTRETFGSPCVDCSITLEKGSGTKTE